MLNMRYKVNILRFVVIGIMSTFMLISCANFAKSQKKFENQVITYQVKELKKPYSKDRDKLRAKEKIEILKEGKFKFISAKTAFEVYKKYPGAQQVIMALRPTVSSVLSSSQALESLKPAMWWGVKLHGGGGVYPDATVAAYPGDFWNLDVVFNCTSYFEEPSMTQLPERACFSGADNTNDLYYGLESPSFPTGGPNGIMQFEFSSSSNDTFLGVFSMSGDSENVELYVDETLVTTYNVTYNNGEYAFLVDLPAGRHFITAVYISTSSDRASPQLVYTQLLLYRI